MRQEPASALRAHGTWTALVSVVRCPCENDVASFLDGTLSAVHRGELETHLADCSRCQELVACLVRAGSTHETSNVRGGASDVRESGDRIGRYVVLQRVGAGAMGIVYAARDPELGRDVALKLVRSESAVSRERLFKEAQALARLAHPNVVTVFEVGTSHGEVFLAMEYVDGVTLARWLPERALADILDVFIQAGRGLSAAHAVGIVHRDFKPENVLVGNDGRVRVVDFGLARAGLDGGSASSRADERLVVHTVEAGTPAYMSPEQHLNVRADARSDQFSFCVALYEALHGERPFAGDRSDELARHVVEGRRRRRARRWKHPLSSARRIDALLRRGLETDPRKRHASLDELVALLVIERNALGDVRRRRSFVLPSMATLALLLFVARGAIASKAPPIAAPPPAAIVSASAPAAISPSAGAGVPAEVSPSTALGRRALRRGARVASGTVPSTSVPSRQAPHDLFQDPR